MKTNEEFLEGVYSKRDALVKKRKKRVSVAATAACAVLCVGVAVTAGVFNSESADKAENKSEIELGHMSLGENASGETNYIYIYDDAAITKAAYGVDGETSEIVEEVSAAEGMPEAFNQSGDNAQFVTQAADNTVGSVTQTVDGEKIYREESEPEIGTSVIEMPEEETQSGGAAATTAAPSSAPMPSTEQLVEAAYNSLTDEEKQCVIKDSAEATVTRYADGTQIYTVGFRTTLDQYWSIKLDSELNVIPQNAS